MHSAHVMTKTHSTQRNRPHVWSIGYRVFLVGHYTGAVYVEVTPSVEERNTVRDNFHTSIIFGILFIELRVDSTGITFT